MKSIWQSRTFWFNALTVASVLVVAITDNELLSSGWGKWLLVLQAGLNVVLRLMTKEPVAIRKPRE